MKLTTLLTVIFVIAKLIGLINWSWWICLLPSILYFAVCLVLIIIVALFS